MTRVCFFKQGGLTAGFEISGHSGYAQSGSDIVCASVSSCAYMVANTITDVMNVSADARVDEGYMYFSVEAQYRQKCADIFNGFILHITELQKQYPKNLKVTFSEV